MPREHLFQEPKNTKGFSAFPQQSHHLANLVEVRPTEGTSGNTLGHRELVSLCIPPCLEWPPGSQPCSTLPGLRAMASEPDGGRTRHPGNISSFPFCRQSCREAEDSTFYKEIFPQCVRVYTHTPKHACGGDRKMQGVPLLFSDSFL